VEVVTVQSKTGHRSVSDFRPKRVHTLVEARANLQSGLRAGVRDQADDRFVVDQRATAPIFGDVANHAVLDLVPLRDQRKAV
jgi:hypothetical protein